MRIVLESSLAVIAAVSAAGLACATTFRPVDRTCPIGGERFTSLEMGSNSHFGTRPDGKPYSPTPIVPLTECPENGFVFYDEAFSEAELALIEPIVASSEYQTMRRTETQHYRAWWLLIHSGRTDPAHIARLLLTASWETDEAPERKARYQGIFAGAAAALERSATDGEEWFWLNLRAANALRELGRFDRAAEVLDKIDREDVLPQDKEALDGARYWIDGLRRLVEQKNRASEPAAAQNAEGAADGLSGPE